MSLDQSVFGSDSSSVAYSDDHNLFYWSNETRPIGVTSLLLIILFPSFDFAKVNQVVPNYSRTINSLFLSRFMLAIVLENMTA